MLYIARGSYPIRALCAGSRPTADSCTFWLIPTLVVRYYRPLHRKSLSAHPRDVSVLSLAACVRLECVCVLATIEETLRRSLSRRLLLSPSGEVQVELLARKNKQREDSVCRHLIALHLAQALTAPLGKSVGSAGP